MADLVNAISRSLWAVTKFQHFLFQFILWWESDDVANVVKSAFAIADLADDVPYTSNTFDLFADLILYDPLRAYVRDYFIVNVDEGADISNLPQFWPESRVYGLDEEQRKLIYQKFSTVRWVDQTRPPVKDYKDLSEILARHDNLQVP